MAQPSRKKSMLPSPDSGRRGRPTADRAQAIDASIRAAALDIFLEIGFETASMDAIAAQAPVSKATLYARYESKKQLFRAILEEEMERLSAVASVNDHLLPTSLAERLRCHAFTLVKMNHQLRSMAFGSLIVSALRTFPELEADWQELGTGRFLKFLAKDIANTDDAQNLSPQDRDFLASLFLHSITGHNSSGGRNSVSEAEILAFADQVIETILLVVSQRGGHEVPG